MAKKKSASIGKRPAGKVVVKSSAKKAKASAPKKGKAATKAPTKPVKAAKKAAAKPVPQKAQKAAKKAPAKGGKTPVHKAIPTKKAPLKATVATKKAVSAPASSTATTKAPAKPQSIRPANLPNEAVKPAPQSSEAPKTVAARTPPPKKRPAKERVVMEFYLNSSPNALYELLSTPSGFSEWYCQDVDVRGDQYTFIWDGEREETTMIGRKLGEVIRFRRNNDEDPEAFFEFRVRIDAMTNEVCLVVTDHAWPGEVQETRNLWTSQIETLGRVLGA